MDTMIRLTLFVATALVGSVPSASSVLAVETAADVLERVEASIVANQGSAETVRLVAKASISISLASIGDGPWPENLTRPPEGTWNGRIEFVADDAGRRFAWLESWSADANIKPRSSVRMAMDGTVVLDASEPRQGYLRAYNDSMVSQFDFYRHHFLGGIESLKSYRESAEQQPQEWELIGSPENPVIRLIHTIEEEGKTFREGIEVRRDWAYLPSRISSINEIDIETWTWVADEKSGIWYPKTVNTSSTGIVPNVLKRIDSAEYVIESFVANEPVSDQEFTFEGLGLQPNSIVYDMRTSPPTQTVFQPNGENLDAAVAGAGAVRSPGQQPAASIWTGPALIAANAILLAGLAIGWLVRRRFRSPR